jgi:GTP cyclohydrolase I
MSDDMLKLGEALFTKLLSWIGDDRREGIAETPRRAAAAWIEWTSGYGVKPEEVLKSFEDGAQGYDEMVLLRDIPVYSHCEHHLAPFFGIAHVAYIPRKRIVGISKLSRLVDIFAKRLQVQERMTVQIADALVEHLDPVGVGVMLQCRHLCMESRGVQRSKLVTVTTVLRGALKDGPARDEFLKTINSGGAV